MPFCFFTQNFAEIGKSVDELWSQKRFLRCRSPPSWISKISIFGHVTAIACTICCSVPNFIEIGQFFTEIRPFNDFQDGGRPPSWILKICRCLSCGLCRHAILLLHTKIRRNRKIGRWVMATKAIFKMAVVAIFSFKNVNFWSRDCDRVHHLL